MKAFFILIISLSFSLIAFGQADSLARPDARLNKSFGQDSVGRGFTNKAEAKNLTVNGLKEGKWVEDYYEGDEGTNDKKAPYYLLTIYRNGKPNGIRRVYWKKGSLLEEEKYANGVRNGVRKIYYENGKIDEETPFVNDTIKGVFKKHYMSGKLESETYYTNGYIVGGGKSYYESGKIQSVDKDTTINGTDLIIEYGFYEDGKLERKTIWYNPAEGDDTYYDENGKEKKL